jgi:putative transposase
MPWRWRRVIGTRAPLVVAARPNARWSIDFIHDQMACGRRFRILNILDDATKECLAAVADTSISGKRVARAQNLIAWRGKPELIVSDNGTEFSTGRASTRFHGTSSRPASRCEIREGSRDGCGTNS